MSIEENDEEGGVLGRLLEIHRDIRSIVDGQGRIEAAMKALQHNAIKVDEPEPVRLRSSLVSERNGASNHVANMSSRGAPASRTSSMSFREEPSSLKMSFRETPASRTSSLDSPAAFPEDASAVSNRTSTLQFSGSKRGSNMSLASAGSQATSVGGVLDQLQPRKYHSRCHAASFGTSRSYKDRRSSHVSQRGVYSQSFFPVHPTCSHRLFFDCLSVLLLFYDSIMVPLTLAWSIKPEGGHFWIGSFTTFFWIVDLALGFVTGFREGEDLVMEIPSIIRRYLRTWFTVDLLAIICDLIWISSSLAARRSDGAGESLFMRIGRIAKAGRTVRILAKFRTGIFRRADDFVRHCADNVGLAAHVPFILVAAKLIILILWFNHLISCLWYATGNFPHSDTGLSWHETLIEQYDYDAFPDRFWYLTGMYWAISTMFGGAAYLVPSNTAEAIFTQIYVVISALFASTITSSLAAILVEQQVAQQDMNSKLQLLMKFLNQHRVSTILAISVPEQVQRQMTAEKRLSFEDVRESVRLVSRNLQLDLRWDLFSRYMLKSAFFRTCDILDEALVIQLCYTAIDHTYAPGEEIFAEGEDINKGYLCIWGDLHYTQLMSATDDGPGGWICEQTFWVYWRSQGTLETLTSCELLSVSTEHFEKTVVALPEVLAFATRYSQQICEAMNNEELDSLSDLRTTIDDDSIMAVMPHSIRERVSHHVLSAGSTARGLFGIFEHMSKGREALEQEIKEGKCHLTFVEVHSQQVMLRVVQLVVLRVTNGDSLLCVRVAKWKNGVSTPALALPAEKVQKNEDPKDTLRRFCEDELGCIGAGMVVESHETMVERATSASYGMDTKYIRRVYYASMVKSGDDMPGGDHVNIEGLDPGVGTQCLGSWQHTASQREEEPAYRRRSRRASTTYSWNTTALRQTVHVNTEAWKAFAVRTQEGASIYAWMPEDDFSCLSASFGNSKEIVSAWLESITEAEVEEMLECTSPAEAARVPSKSKLARLVSC